MRPAPVRGGRRFGETLYCSSTVPLLFLYFSALFPLPATATSRHHILARRVDGNGHGPVRLLDQALGYQVGLHFQAAHVRQHVAVDLHARAERLPALLHHFLALVLNEPDSSAAALEKLLARLEQLAGRLGMDFVSLLSGNEAAVLGILPTDRKST